MLLIVNANFENTNYIIDILIVGDNSASLLEWLSFWTSKYCSEVSAVRIAGVTDVDEDGAISSDEWIATFLRLKARKFMSLSK